MKDRIARFVPRSLLAAARDAVGLPPRVAFTYWRLRASRVLHSRVDAAILRTRPRSVLFVCHGNIMRSPFAAELSRSRLGLASEWFIIGSAGTGAAIARPADPRAIAAAARHGISLASHRSRPITSELIEQTDLICVMDHRNEAEVVGRFPRASRKTVLLGGVEPIAGQPAEIPDPYLMEEAGVAHVYERLSAAVEALVRRLMSV